MKKILFIATLLASWLPFSTAHADIVAKIGTTGYETLAAAVSAAAAGQTVEITTADTYTLPNLPQNITIQGDVDGVEFNCFTGANNSVASVPNGATFKNLTFNWDDVNYHGFQHAGTINMENCKHNGRFFSYGNMNFTNCDFVYNGDEYCMWVYGAGTVVYDNCTFTNNVKGKLLHLYCENPAFTHSVSVKDCKFINNGAASKAAINVKATNGLTYDLAVNNCTTEGSFPAASTSSILIVLNNLVQVDKRPASGENISVEMDNVVVYDNGAEVEVEEISTVAELKAFRDAVNSGTSYAGKIVRLMADLDLSSETNWQPIGNLVAYPGQSFKGTFDGAGHTISNLTVNDTTPNHAVAALFGSIAEGSIVNLTVKNVNIKSTHYAGGIVAYTSNTPSVINCHVIGGTISSTPEIVNGSYDNGDKVGGIMGYCTTGTTIKDCTVEGLTVRAYRDLAGICGYAGGEVSDCTVKDVTVIQDNTNGYKDEDVSYTACEVVGGRSANAAATNAANTTENVTITSAGNGVAQIGTTTYATLQEALDAAEAEDTPNIVIDLLDDATLDITAWDGAKNPLSIGTANTLSITINGNGHTLTFNQKNSDWNNVATMNDAQTKLILNNMNITNSGYNNGPWNRHDINFNCAVELNNVTSDKALAFKNDATLNDVTVNDTGDIYAIWVSPRTEGGQTISINGLNVTCGRGIKIDDQYVDNPVSTTLEIEDATFTTSKKSAILVKTAGGADITVGENVDITNVAADPNNIVWVDEDRADEYYNVTVTVTVTGTVANLIPEGGEVHYVASLVRGNQTRGYYATFAAAYNSTDFEVGDTYELLKTTTEAVEVAKALTIVKNGCTAANLTAADGFKKTETDEAITFVAFNPVCEIAGVQYYTLAAAVSAAQTAGGVQTITLLSDVGPETVTIEEDANFQLTIDGKKDETTNYSVEALIIVDGKRGNGGSNTNGASVTLQNIAFVNNQAQNVITAQHYPHHLTIQDCTYQGSAASLNNWFLNISDGPLYGVTVKNVTAENTRLIQGKLGLEAVFEDIVATSDIKAGLNVNVAGTLLVKNCQITTGKYAFRDATEAYTGIITLEGNTFISTSTEADEGAIVNRGGQNGVGQINVVSGTYTGEIRELNGHTLLNITGGTYTQDVTDYVAEGYMVKNLGNGTYTVIKAVAQIGTTMYETLEEAFAAATDGQTITLLADCAGNGIKVPQGKFTTGLTVDFAGHTYTVDGETVGSTGTETQAFQLLKDNKLTFKNGTIYSEKALFLVQNYSNLTLEGMTLTLNNSGYTSAYTLSNNNGNIVIDGSTINANPAGGFAFDVCRYASYSSVNVEVKGESVINGDIEISASKSDAKDGFGLTLTAGTLTGKIVVDATAAAAMEKTPEKATVTKADDFDVDAPEGYIWQSNGDGTSKLDMPTVSVGSKGFATLSSTYALDFTDVENIYAYIAVIKDGEVTYKRIRKVPAGTGLLLRNPAGTSDKAKVPVLASTATAESTQGNRFVAVSETITALATEGNGVTNYILNSNGVHGVGFYQANNKKVAAGKAYLAIPTGTPVLVKALVFDEDDATGIAEVESFDEGTQATYNLAGQRVPARSAQKGIYIVNGKKIIK